MKGWKATDLFANIEYEIDELDRDENLINEAQRARLRVIYYHDQCVVEPGAILNAVCLIGILSNLRRENQCPSFHPF